MARTDGEWPAPLDDVFIHFDFARAAAAGHPFEWIAGQGYSSGETSPLYALVLATGYAVGFRGLSLGVWATLVAVVCVVVAMRSLIDIVPARKGAHWLGAIVLVCVGSLAWSLWSGMEVALFYAVLSRMLVWVVRARAAGPMARSRAQWRVGLLGALLVWTRPEAAVVVAPLAVVVARAPGSRSPWAALSRASMPGALATLSVLALNYAMTGDAESAGARLKLLSSNPFLSDTDRARELALNVFHFGWKVCLTELGATPRLAWLVPATAMIGLFSARSRDLSAALLVACVLYVLLVSYNGAARYQNFRYYAPALELLLFAAVVGMATLPRAVGLAAGAVIGVGALSRTAPEIDFFSRASANIHAQQVEMGRRVARETPLGATVLVGDAGAIPYVSGRACVDALGLGGYHRAPFTLAASGGEASTLEVLQRLAPELRPTHLALYPNWFPEITSRFGRELDHVTIEDNVICGGTTKTLYLADFAALDGDAPPPGELIDEVDVGDVASEAAHGYESPAPFGGWTTLDVRDNGRGARVFDGGRIVPAGRSERFIVVPSPEGAKLVVRTDSPLVSATATSGGVTARLERGASGEGAWTELSASLSRVGGAVTIACDEGTLRDFHVWLVR